MAAAEKVAEKDNNPMTPNAPTIERARAGERLAATAEGDVPAARYVIAEGREKAGSPAASAVRKDVCSNERMAFWTGGYVNFGSFDTSGAAILDFMTVGLAAGADYRLFDALTLGVATGYATDKSKIDIDGHQNDDMPLTVGADVKIGEDLAVSFDCRTEIGAPGDDNTFRMSLTGAF